MKPSEILSKDEYRAEVRQCALELQEAANLLRRNLPAVASLYEAAAKRARALSEEEGQ